MKYYDESIFFHNLKESILKNGITKLAFLISLLALTVTQASAQSEGSGSGIFITSLIVLAAIILLGVLFLVANNLLLVEAKETGADKSGANYSLIPGLNEIFRPKSPDYVDGAHIHYLSKGHDILLAGEAERVVDTTVNTTTYAIQPGNFIGISPIPKVTVEVGDEVKAGDIIFFDKKRPNIKYATPVSGEVVAINRGQKRSIANVVILADKDMKYRTYDSFDLESGSREDLVNFLLESGAWPMIRQRPFDVVPEANDIPKAIFISTFDTAPLAPDMNLVVEGRGAAFQKGLDVLKKLTPGKVHLGLNARGKSAPSAVFTEATGVEKHWFHGKHPAGNVGIQIHHIDPINANEKVWTMGVQDVITLGGLFTDGQYDASRIISIGGTPLKNPRYIKTYQGANIENLVKSELNSDEELRFISGDVLSGEQKAITGFLNFSDDQLTVIKEGKYYEMFGWLLPITPRPSISSTIPSSLFSKLKYDVDTNTHGEHRAFVVTGQYEKVLPMDIYPQHLMKAIIVNDFERMEGLGIYELSEEDVALCEFVCTSKQPLQKILRQGLNVVREQS